MPVVSQFGSRPLRNVPWTIRLRALIPAGGNPLGFFIVYFGLAFFLIMMPFALVCLPTCNLSSLWKFSGPLRAREGMIRSVMQLPYSYRGERVYAVTYIFICRETQGTVEGFSYHRGPVNLKNSDRVTIEYDPRHPTNSRIKGFNELIIHFNAVILLPLIGIAIICLGFIPGLKNIALMKGGIPAWGTLFSSELSTVPGHYYLFFQFSTQDNQQSIASLIRMSFKPAWSDYLRSMPSPESDSPPNPPREVVFYNPRMPDEVFIPAQLGNDITVSEDGKIAGNDMLSVIMTLIPLCVIALGAVISIAIVIM